jgi:uncharacterized protein (DUF58 family)
LANPDRRSELRQFPVRWSLSAHGRRLLTMALAGLLIALVTGRPEFAGLAAPALLVLTARGSGRPAALAVRFELADPQILEDLDTAVLVAVGGQRNFEAELRLDPAEDIAAGPPVILAPQAAPADGDAARPALRHARLPVAVQHWGHRPIGLLTITLRDRYRLSEGIIQLNLPWIDCRPHPAPMTSTIVLSRLPSRLGEHASRTAGEGIEFVGVREFVPGDRQRRVNWPATTRHGSLYLNTFAAERTEHVVVIADATTDIGKRGLSTLDLVLRGSAGAITRYLTARDRVGLIIFGSKLNWIAPGQGRRHLHRLLQLLVSVPGGWERSVGLTRLPRAALPPGSLVLVFSPLLDPRIVEAIRDMRERGFNIVVVDVLDAQPRPDNTQLSALTSRIWRLEQSATRFSMAQLGVPIVHWDGQGSLDDALSPFARRVLVVH